MEQMTLFTPPYKYIIDASSILSQKADRQYRRKVHKTLWDHIDQFVSEQIIVTCSEIAGEIKDEPIIAWMKKQNCLILPIDYDVQRCVCRIVNDHPKMLDFTGCKSSGDAFLIATAMTYKLTVITEENPDNPNKIPQICKGYNIKAVNINEMCDLEGIVA